MIRTALAFLMALHGVAHLVGFAVPWRLTHGDEITYKTTLLAGRLDVGDLGIRIVGIVWLGLAVAFVASAVGAFTQQPWWTAAATWTAVASLGMSLLSLPEAKIGVPVNLVVLATLLIGGRVGWW